MVTRLLLISVGVLIVAQTPVFAYTDPGSGTLILQMLLAAAFGVMFYLRRIIGWFRRLKSNRETTTATVLSATTEKESESIKA
jgi:hypothetical protein